MVNEPAPATPLPPPASILWLTGVALGLATGLGEVGYLSWRGQTRISDGLGPHMLWMTPVASLLWFLAAAAILVLLRRRLSYPTSVGLLLGLATVSLLSHARLNDWAILLLAAGVAVQGTRLTRGREATAVRLLSRPALPLLILVGLLGIGVGGRERRAERRALAGLPAPASDVNVLLLVLDTVRAMDLTLYGLGRPTTPGLDRWARDGVVFDWAFSTASWTLPSHASLFTGKPAHELAAGWTRPLDRNVPTLAEELRRRGYLTAGFISNLRFVSRDWGLDRGFSRYEDHPITPDELLVSSALGFKLQSIRPLRRLLGLHEMPGRKSAAALNRDFLSWLDAQSDERPFFAFINYFDAHQPYLPPPELDRRFLTSDQPRAHYYDYRLHDVGYERKHRFTAAEFQREREAYQATIAYLDQELDRLFTELRRRSLLDRTIVIVTSDHGEHFGEYGLDSHGNSLYTQLSRVPLLLRYPAAIPGGGRIATPVSLGDVAATVLALTGTAGNSPFPGVSLARYWGARSAVDTVPILMSFQTPTRDLFRGLVFGSYHLLAKSGRVEGGLFDLASDPFEEHSMAGDSRYSPVRVRLQAMLDSLIPAAPPPRRRPAE